MASDPTARRYCRDRLLIVTAPHGLVVSVKPRHRYYRLAVWRYGLRWHVGRSTSSVQG